MTNSHKKTSSHAPAQAQQAARRVTQQQQQQQMQLQRPRSASTKKQPSSHSTVVPAPTRPRSASSKKKAEWDSTNHDLSVHKLPMKKLLEKQLQMMSKETLCKIAGIEPPVRASRPSIGHHTDDLLSPPTRKQSRSSMSSTDSHTPVDSSVTSTPESVSRHDDSSVGSTPSPEQRPASAASRARQPLTHEVRAKAPAPSQQQAKKAVQQPPSTAQAPAIPIAIAVPRRRSAAPTTTTAPPRAQPQEDEDSSYLSSSTSSNAATTASQNAAAAQAEQTFTPWLKQDAFLSPVLERSIEASTVAGSPNRMEQFNDALPEQLSSPEQEEQGRNLLLELRQSLDHHGGARQADIQAYEAPSTAIPQLSVFSSSSRPVAEPAAQPNNATLIPLLTRLAQHLAERPERAATEKAFKSTVVESFAQAATQVKSLQSRVERAAAENQQLREQAKERELVMSQRFQEMERRMEQMASMMAKMNTGAPSAAMPTPQLSYDPAMYNSQRPAANYQREEKESSFSNSFSSPQQAPQQPQQQRAPSPPRPIVIGHRTAFQQPQQQMTGQRLADMNVQLTGASIGNRPAQPTQAPVVVQAAQNKIAWQTYAAKTNQPKPAAQPAQAPSQAQAAQAFRSTLTNTSHHDSSHLDDSFSSESDSLSARTSSYLSVPAHSSSAAQPTPLSPGEAEEAQERERFERERRRATERIGQQQQQHMQQTKQQQALRRQ